MTCDGQYAAAKWLPDGRGVVFFGGGTSAPWRTYLQDVNGGLPRPITPDGVSATSISPDGRFLAGRVEHRLTIFPTGGGSPRSIADLLPDESVACWSGDGRSVVVGRIGTSLALSRLDVSTGARTELRTFSVPDPAGVWVRNPLLAHASQGYAYSYYRWLDALYVAAGLK